MSGVEWSNYWRGSKASAAFSSGGVNHPMIDRYWADIIKVIAARTPRTLFDVACGSGALVNTISKELGSDCEIYASDISPDALAILRKQSPSCRVFVGDALTPPLLAPNFDVIVSQFGVEYAGVQAVSQLPGIGSSRALVALLLHGRDSLIWRDSQNGLRALSLLAEYPILDNTRVLFETAYESIRTGKFAKYQAAADLAMANLRVVHTKLEAIEACSAKAALQDVLAQITKIHDRLEHYNEDEVCVWVDTIEREFVPYEQRLTSMLSAALDQSEITHCIHSFSKAGFEIRMQGRLAADNGFLGYQLVAVK